MAGDVDAVIAALRVALEEAQKSSDHEWKISAANLWIRLLPGTWIGRRRRLKLSPAVAGGDTISRVEFVGHVRAAIAFLDAERKVVGRPRRWRRRHGGAPAAMDGAQRMVEKTGSREPINLLRARKPLPGVH